MNRKKKYASALCIMSGNYLFCRLFTGFDFLGRGFFYLLVLVISSVRVSAATGGLPLSLNFDPPADRVRIDTPLTVRCELSTMDTEARVQGALTDGVSMLLHCPIAPWGSFCFLNCKSACANEEPGKCPFIEDLGNVTCQKIVTQEGHVKYEYTISRLTKRWITQRDASEPGFYCRSAGLKTPEVWLQEASDPPVAKPGVILPDAQQSPNQPVAPATPSGSIERPGLESYPSPNMRPPDDTSRETNHKGKQNGELGETVVIQKSDLEAKSESKFVFTF